MRTFDEVGSFVHQFIYMDLEVPYVGHETNGRGFGVVTMVAHGGWRMTAAADLTKLVAGIGSGLSERSFMVVKAPDAPICWTPFAYGTFQRGCWAPLFDWCSNAAFNPGGGSAKDPCCAKE
jgi:hypothetical protein